MKTYKLITFDFIIINVRYYNNTITHYCYKRLLILRKRFYVVIEFKTGSSGKNIF